MQHNKGILGNWMNLFYCYHVVIYMDVYRANMALICGWIGGYSTYLRQLSITSLNRADNAKPNCYDLKFRPKLRRIC